MAGTNSFYPFAVNTDNTLTNAQYQADAGRQSGNVPGEIARAALVNKALKQGAAVAVAVGAVVAGAGFDASDADPSILSSALQQSISLKSGTLRAASVTLSGTTYTAVVPDLLGIASGNLPAVFNLLLILPAECPDNATISIIGQANGTEILNYPIYTSPNSPVKAEGIPAGAAIELLISVTENKAYYSSGGGKSDLITVTLPVASWVKDSTREMWTQAVTHSSIMDGVRIGISVDDDTQLALMDAGVTLRIDNNNGTATAKAFGAIPESNITAQLTLTPVEVVA